MCPGVCARARVHTRLSAVALFSHLRVGKLTPVFCLEGVRMVVFASNWDTTVLSKPRRWWWGLSASLPSPRRGRLMPTQSRSGGGRPGSPPLPTLAPKGGARASERASRRGRSGLCGEGRGQRWPRPQHRPPLSGSQAGSPDPERRGCLLGSRAADQLRSPRAVLLPAPPGPPPRAPSAPQAR